MMSRGVTNRIKSQSITISCSRNVPVRFYSSFYKSAQIRSPLYANQASDKGCDNRIVAGIHVYVGRASGRAGRTVPSGAGKQTRRRRGNNKN